MADAAVFDASRMYEVQNAVGMSMLPLTHMQCVPAVVIRAGAVRAAAQTTEDRLTTSALDDGSAATATKTRKATPDDPHRGVTVVGRGFDLHRVFHA